jgi:hypothetical protein
MEQMDGHGLSIARLCKDHSIILWYLRDSKGHDQILKRTSSDVRIWSEYYVIKNVDGSGA